MGFVYDLHKLHNYVGGSYLPLLPETPNGETLGTFEVLADILGIGFGISSSTFLFCESVVTRQLTWLG